MTPGGKYYYLIGTLSILLNEDKGMLHKDLMKAFEHVLTEGEPTTEELRIAMMVKDHLVQKPSVLIGTDIRMHLN